MLKFFISDNIPNVSICWNELCSSYVDHHEPICHIHSKGSNHRQRSPGQHNQNAPPCKPALPPQFYQVFHWRWDHPNAHNSRAPQNAQIIPAHPIQKRQQITSGFLFIYASISPFIIFRYLAAASFVSTKLQPSLCPNGLSPPHSGHTMKPSWETHSCLLL